MKEKMFLIKKAPCPPSEFSNLLQIDSKVLSIYLVSVRVICFIYKAG